MHQHFVHFYDDAAVLADGICDYIGAGLTAGEAGVVIATPALADRIDARFRAFGMRDGAAAAHPGRYLMLDAAATLSRFMVEDWPDDKRFAETIGGFVRQAAAAGNGQVRMFGEMVAVLMDERKAKAALRLEELWNALAASHSFSLHCAYPLGVLARPDAGATFLQICAQHSRFELPKNLWASDYLKSASALVKW